ncbi:unnamed protein product, partial [Brachionus calyciflorus]
MTDNIWLLNYMIYNKSSAKIILNMYETLSIFIKSVIKQGCALSMMLYIIAIEELMLKIKQNNNIKGYKVYGLEEREIKLTAYADDIPKEKFGNDGSAEREAIVLPHGEAHGCGHVWTGTGWGTGTGCGHGVG